MWASLTMCGLRPRSLTAGAFIELGDARNSFGQPTLPLRAAAIAWCSLMWRERSLELFDYSRFLTEGRWPSQPALAVA